MNYYIQGDAANADKIKAAFEKLGYSDKGFTFDVNDILFFTASNKHINVCPANGWLANIIKTHPDYKELELELPAQPKFKVGDEIVWTEPKSSKPTEPVKIIQLIDKDKLYMVDMSNGVGYVAYDMQDYYKLVPKPHYDISNFHAGMPVLVRDKDYQDWNYVLFSHCVKYSDCRFGAGSTIWRQCIPFNDDTKHLLGTTDPCGEEYINW